MKWWTSLLLDYGFRRLFTFEVGGLAERVEGFGRIHARGPQKVYGRGPDLADEHTGPEVALIGEHGGGLFCRPEGEPAGVHGMLGLFDVELEGLDGVGEAEDGLRERLWDGHFLAYRRRGGAREHPCVADSEVQLVGRPGIERELPERPPAWRGEFHRVIAGVERLPERVHAFVGLARFLQGVLGHLEVAGSQRGRRLA